MARSRTRRRFLQVSGSIAVGALAGCAGTDDSGSGGADTETTDDGMTDGEMTETGVSDGEMTEDGTADGGMTETADAMEGPVDITVRIENVAPSDFYGPESHTGGAIWITPGVFAVHTDANPIHTPGDPASIGLEALAEAGPPTGFEGEPGLVDELSEMTGSMGVAAAGAYTPEDTVSDPNDPTGSAPGAPPIAPGGAFEFATEIRPGGRLSVASMVVPSNDIYVSAEADGIPLWPVDGDPVSGDVTGSLALFDAGTEPNGEPGFGADQAPAQSAPEQGVDEDGVVRRLSAIDDGGTYPAVDDIVRVTVSTDGMDG